MDLCSCRSAPALCDRCCDDRFAQLRGVAASRGSIWAESAWPKVHRADRSKPWPVTPRARQLAEAKVADIGTDARLHARLADELEAEAARRWDQLRNIGHERPIPPA